MDESDSEGGDEQGGQSGFSIELLKSYLAFAKRGLLRRKLLIALIATVGLVLTGLTYQYIPRTFRSTTVLMSVPNPVLDAQGSISPFAGVNNLILRRENLEEIVRSTGLVRNARERRPPLLKLKDSISESVRGQLSDSIMASVLVATLESRVTVDTERDTLSVSVDWSDGVTATELVEAATQSFLKVRHAQEIAAFSDKMAILDQHATKLREEIADVAKQLQPSFDTAKTLGPRKAGELAGPASKLPLVRVGARRPPLAVSPERKQELAELKQKLTAAENERNSRIASERAKLDELKLKFTASHPQVVTQEERVALASQVPSELALLRSEVADLDGQLRQQEALAANAKGGVLTAAVASGADAEASVADPLPPEVMQLLNSEDADPAKTAQLSGAITRYGHLRDDMRGVKLALDVAQAAFNHRYRVVIPVEVPSKPIKPNLVLVVVAGVALSLLLALIVPILLELRKGLIVEYWQVHHFELPVLGELRLPSRRD